MNLHDFNTVETRLAIKILARLKIFENKLNSLMWDKATFPSNKGIFEMTAKRLGTKHMIYVSLLLMRDKNDLPTTLTTQNLVTFKKHFRTIQCMNLHDFNTKETPLAIKILVQLKIFENKLNSLMWDEA